MFNGVNQHHAAATSRCVRRPFIGGEFCVGDRLFQHLVVKARAIQRANIQVDACVVKDVFYRFDRGELRVNDARETIRASAGGVNVLRKDRGHGRYLPQGHASSLNEWHREGRG